MTTTQVSPPTNPPAFAGPRVGLRTAFFRWLDIVGPVGTLIDPVSNRRDMFSRQCANRRHLRAVFGPGESQVHATRGTVPGTDDRDRTAAHRIAPAIEAEAALVDGRSVAAVAVLLENWLNVPCEIHPVGLADARHAGRLRRRGRRW